MPRQRDPLSVEYDGQTLAFLDRLTAVEADGTVLVRGGFVSRTGVASTAIIVAVPPGDVPDEFGGPLSTYQRAFERSLYYNFRAAFTPPGRTAAGGRLPSPFWLRLEWGAATPRGYRGVVRIGPEQARPYVWGPESYVNAAVNARISTRGAL